MHYTEDITSDNYIYYINFVYPSQRNILKAVDGEKVVAVGIMSEKVHIGVAVASRIVDNGSRWRLISLYITPAYRGKGAGKTLLKSIENMLTQKGCEIVNTSYIIPLDKVESINNFIIENGWEDPILKAKIYRWDASIKKNRFLASVIDSGKTPIFEGFTIKSFSELKAEDKDQLKQKIGVSFPTNLSPFINEELADPICSLVLYHGDELAGWIVALRVSGNALLYRSIFVFNEFRGTLAGIFLLQEAIRRHIQYYPSFEAVSSVEVSNKLMNGIVNRIFEERHKSISFEHSSAKNLGGMTIKSEMWSTYVQSAECLESSRKFILNHDMANLVINYIGIQEGMRVLDAGCGTGAFTRYLAYALPKANYIGIDIDSSLVASAQTIAKNLPKEFKLEFIKGNVLKMPFEEESIDIVVSHTLTDNVPDTKKLFSEMVRVLKEGGKIAAVSSMSYGHQALWEGDYPAECSFQKRFLELNEKMYRGYMNICPVDGYLNGIPAVKLPRFFALMGLKNISVYPIGRFFSLSNDAMSNESKHEYIDMWFNSERDKLENYRKLRAFESYAPYDECEEFLKVLKEKADYLRKNVGENEIWEWNGGGNILVVGTKLGNQKVSSL